MNVNKFKETFAEDWNESNIFRIDSEILVKLDDKLYLYDVDKKEWKGDYHELEDNASILKMCQPAKQIFKQTYFQILMNNYYTGGIQVKDLSFLFPEYQNLLEQAVKLHKLFILQAFRQDKNVIKNIHQTSLLKAMEMSQEQMDIVSRSSYKSSKSFFYYIKRLGLLTPSFKGIQNELFEKMCQIAFNDFLPDFELDVYNRVILSKKGKLQDQINKILTYINSNFVEYTRLRQTLERLNNLDDHEYPELPKVEKIDELVGDMTVKVEQLENAELYKTYNEAYAELRKSLLKFEYLDDTYMIVVPKTVEDLDKEGNSLHHCVGTYKSNLAYGVEVVLFLRKRNAPNESYYTIDIDPEGYIRQIHTAYNKDIKDDPNEKELLNFLNKWADNCPDVVRSTIKDHYGAIAHI